VKRLKQWATDAGKRLCLLANSGCLRYCPTQTYHDNLVAHADSRAAQDGIEGLEPLACRRILGLRRHWVAIMQGTWVRPEDLHNYDGLVDVAKLATRTHDRPRLVVDAYARGKYWGNILDLLEPGHGPLLAPLVIANDPFPDDWFDHTSRCEGNCEGCRYCQSVLETALAGPPDHSSPS
jgi:hypothetical protein